MNLSRLVFFLIILFFSTVLNSYAQIYKVLESGTDHLIIEFNFTKYYSISDTTFEGRSYQIIHGEDDSYRNPGDPWTPEYRLLMGVPLNSNPTIKIVEQKRSTFKNKFIIPYPEEDPNLEKQDFKKINVEVYSKNGFYPIRSAKLDESYFVRYSKIIPVVIAPYQFNPVTRDLLFNSKVTVRIDFNEQSDFNFTNINDPTTNEFIESSLINSEVAKGFAGKSNTGDSPESQDDYWYNPNKNYFKLYIKKKNVYRLTYEELVSAGAQLGTNTSTDKLEIFNYGLPVPIDVFDSNDDQLFNEGDYIKFVGYPPKASEYCTQNIYNLSNIYWFSYQSDSSGVKYHSTPSFVGNYTKTYFSNLTTLHFEKDSLYERLGHAPNGKRDFWFWDKASSRDQAPSYIFNQYFETFPNWFFPDSPYVRLKVAMHGMSTDFVCSKDHKAYIKINDRDVGDISWDGQDTILFNKRFYSSPDSIPIYPGNQLSVEVRGDICTRIDDEIRINWFEFEYWRGNSAFGEYYDFKNYDRFGINRYTIFDWEGNDMRIYIPSKNKMMYLPDPGNFQQFVDTMTTTTEYFLASSQYYRTVDSIVADVSSDLRNLSNGADYIIIKHHKFNQIANQLASLRQNNFPDETIPNPRIKIVDVQQIYDEFNYGLLEPQALPDFVKYAFENWTSPAPTYIVLIGDMSYDYRGLLASSRPNFIPSMPYFASPEYGQAVSDNLIVAVEGNDPQPDLAIGRLSIETVEEGNILIQKLADYPDDQSKPWKENVLLLASGLDLQDELLFGFNDASLFLGNNYVVPQGFNASYVFRYPSKPEHIPFQGEGPKIREEINKGAVLVNYYGHGGGYQWDLVFTNDDIFLLENEGRLPLVLSVTCYTAHFDNQDVFGEQFNKVPGKGSIGFYGSSGLTFWGVGDAINKKFFEDVFTNRNYIVGKAIMNSKNRVPPSGFYPLQMNVLTYLGDPVLKLALPEYPDFEIKSNDISLTPENPLLGDSIQVKINISNWGTVFPNDSVVVELFAALADTSYEIGQVKRPNFANKDSVYFTWVPDKGGLYTLTAKINETEMIMEEDHSDNVGTALFIIFNISEPSIITPIDGFVSTSNKIKFSFADIGYYIPKSLEYYIEIDTSINFSSPLYSSGKIVPNKSLINWDSPNLPEGIYYWRARIFDGANFGNWSPVRSFSTMNNEKNGYYAHEDILKTFQLYNMNYSEDSNSLILNTDPLPARPSSKTFISNFLPSPQIPDSVNLSTITTDGTYLYCANIWFYAQGLTDGMSMIYRFGTGYNGTIEGQSYGTFSDFRDTILHNIAYLDGYIYIAIGEPYKIVRINTTTEVIDTVNVPPGIIRDIATVSKGPQYLSSDGQYIYNLAYVDSLLNPKYTLRIFDPSNGWSLVRPEFELFGISYYPGFTGFFVHGESIYTTERFHNYIRRYRLIDGVLEEEFLATEPPPSNFKHYFAWCWDWQHDKIYASVFLNDDPTVVPKFGKFAGYYVDANGEVTTKSVGPVAWWNNLNYNLINTSPSGEYAVLLLGQNASTKVWDTVQVNVPDSMSLSGINADTYPYLKLKISLTDSTFQTTEPMELRSVQFDYHPLNDIYVEREDFNFQQDSLLEGYPVTFDFKARNFGDISADSLTLSFFLNGIDSLIYKPVVSVPADSISNSVEYSINTDGLLFSNKVTAYAENTKREYFYFNNLIEKNFFVARDSTRPLFDVTFDGQQIINNDIVSSTPEIVIKLEDNSPLPLDTSYFTIVHNNHPLRFYQQDLDWHYEGPGTPFVITWTPTLPDTLHKLNPIEKNTLEILAKDASGNFFDSTSYRVTFYVYTQNDIDEVYNYPNPFSSNTYFTFILRGEDKPSNLQIKIFTIAGRLIRDIELTPADLITNFNKIYWDGKDQDGDEIGNGVYIYKVIATFPDQTKTITQKLAKVR